MTRVHQDNQQPFRVRILTHCFFLFSSFKDSFINNFRLDWFANNKVSNTEEENLPPKPRKITSLYSKKEAEIANMDNQKEGEDEEQQEEVKKTKKKLKQKMSKESADGTEEGVEEGKENLENDKEPDTDKTAKRERSLVKTKNNGTSVKQMPQNPFDFIWDTNNLMPMNDGELTNLSRNKSNLGGKIARLDEKEKTLTNYNLNLNDLIDTNSVFSSAAQPANGENASIKENKKAKSEKKKKSKTEKKTKSKTKSNADNNSNQDTNLTSEFLATEQTNSTTGLVKKHDLTLNLAQISTPDVSIV